jgi:hypothetical protein
VIESIEANDLVTARACRIPPSFSRIHAQMLAGVDERAPVL